MSERTFDQMADEVAELLTPQTSVLAITGAGMSADSGMPTYRGIGGLYNDGKLADEGYPIEVVLSGPMFKQRPNLTWKALKQLAAAARGAKPNRGHEILAEMEARLSRVWLLTQNVDSLHHRAGSKKIIDIHGDMRRLYCLECDWSKTLETDEESDLRMELNNDNVPSCPKCGHLVRPDIVLFNEMLPEAKLFRLHSELSRGFDVIAVIGTTAVFPYIAAPVYQAKQKGVPIIEVNPAKSEISSLADYRFEAGAARTLEAIWTRYLKLNPDTNTALPPTESS